MANHISRDIRAEASQELPGMRIHIMDIVHPPGMSMPPDIEQQK